MFRALGTQLLDHGFAASALGDILAVIWYFVYNNY